MVICENLCSQKFSAIRYCQTQESLFTSRLSQVQALRVSSLEFQYHKGFLLIRVQIIILVFYVCMKTWCRNCNYKLKLVLCSLCKPTWASSALTTLHVAHWSVHLPSHQTDKYNDFNATLTSTAGIGVNRSFTYTLQVTALSSLGRMKLLWCVGISYVLINIMCPNGSLNYWEQIRGL